jgi:hypothetical protein
MWKRYSSFPAQKQWRLKLNAKSIRVSHKLFLSYVDLVEKMDTENFPLRFWQSIYLFWVTMLRKSFEIKLIILRKKKNDGHKFDINTK